MKKILYVEDNQDTAEAVKIILSNVGFDVALSACGKDALLAAKQHFDMVLLDIMLPDMSGWDIFEKLRHKKETKFAFLSAIPVSSERMKELKKAGVSDYITKPFIKDDLINRIKKVLK
jgi:DNA-binding response OmpR family regulator